MTKGNRNFTSAAPSWLMLFAWFCLISSFSLASPVPPCPSDCECSQNRDGLQKATCTNLQRGEIAYPNIHILVLKPSDDDIECNIPEDISLLFPQLNFIFLKNCSLTYLSSNSFYDLKSLQEVDLSHNSIRIFNHSLFAANTKLRYVNLENNPLDLGSQPLLSSDSIWEVNLASCNLDRLPPSTLEGLPNLRDLSLADNRLETIGENSLPSGLKRLNLSGNRIANVPLPELNRLQGLKEIDVSRNPINCTCQLMGFQDRVSGKGTAFRNQIRCASPAKYAGYSLANVPQYQLCDVKAQRDQLLISNNIGLTGGYVTDEQFSKFGDDDFLFDVKLDKVVGKESKHHRSRRSSSPSEKMPKGSDGTVVEGSGDEMMNIEGSGDGSADESEIPMTTSTQKNESATVAPVSAVPIDSKEASLPIHSNEFNKSLNKLTSEGESMAAPSSPSTLTTEEGSGESTLVYEADTSETNSSKPASSDSDATILRNEPEATKLPDGVGEVTPISATSVSSDSVSSGSSASQEGSTDNSNSALSAPTSPAEGALSQVDDGSVGEIMSPTIGDDVRGKVAAATEKSEENETSPESTTVSPIEADGEKEAGIGKLSRTEIIPNELGAAITSTVHDKPKETTNPRSSEKKDGAAESTAEPIQGQMAKNEKVKSATGTPYIIPTLLIFAVVLICLSIYLSQHNCKPRGWNRSDPKVNHPTELQDVSLLGPDAGHQNSDSYSKKYETEGKNPQTEKLMNGNDGGGGDYSDENNGALPASKALANDNNVPDPVKKSTTRVTTNYESLPRTPTIIHKS